MNYCLLFVFLAVAVGKNPKDEQDPIGARNRFRNHHSQSQSTDVVSPHASSGSIGFTNDRTLNTLDNDSSRSELHTPSKQTAYLPTNTLMSFSGQRKSDIPAAVKHLQRRTVILRRTSPSRAPKPEASGSSEPQPEKSLARDTIPPKRAGSPPTPAGKRHQSPEWRRMTGPPRLLESQLPNPGRGIQTNVPHVRLIPARAGVMVAGFGVGHTASPAQGAMYFPTGNRRLPSYREVNHHSHVVAGAKIYAQGSGELSHASAHAEGRHVQVHLEPDPNSSAYFETGTSGVLNRFVVVHGKPTQHNFSGPGQSGTVRAIGTIQGSGYLRVTANNRGFAPSPASPSRP